MPNEIPTHWLVVVFFFQVALWDSMPIGMQTQRIRSDYLFLVTNLRLGIDLQSPRTRAA